jgi:hypothetical protein
MSASDRADARPAQPSLQGDLARFHLAEVLQLLRLASATGRLALTREREYAELWIERGSPQFVRTSGASVRTGELLVHRGRLNPATLERLLAVQRADPGRRIGQLMIEAGAVSIGDVRDAVQEGLRRIVYGLLLWREGTFAFLPGERPGGEDVTLELDLDRLILEGLRLADESGSRG